MICLHSLAPVVLGLPFISLMPVFAIDVYHGGATTQGSLLMMFGANPAAVQRIKEIAWSGTEHWPTLLDQRAEMSGTLVLSEFTRAAIAKFRK